MKITMNLAENSYDIFIEKGLIKNAGKYLDLNRKVLIVTDDGVPEQYVSDIASQCAHPNIITLPHGERSKSIDELQHLLREMVKQLYTRSDCVMAVGGGVVGDLAGFAASCYMRGIDFYNIPTTLLSQVDSSVGGKTAIDFEGVKNIVGAFYQPKMVLIDPDTLHTLDSRQLSAGLAEAIKMAATCKADLFDCIENTNDLYSALPEIITQSVGIKKSIVEADPKESGLRRVLNFGHTVGHAIESLHEGDLLHGECVGLGMLFMCNEDTRLRLSAVLRKYGLPAECHDTPDSLLPYIVHDKKSEAGIIKTVYVDKIGSYEFKDMRVEELLKIMEDRR